MTFAPAAPILCPWFLFAVTGYHTEPPGGIINEHPQRAIFPAPFKPVVGTAVYLDQLAKSGAALKHWMRAHCTASSGAPVIRHNHQLVDTPDGLLHAVQPGEFLVSQRRPEVPVMYAIVSSMWAQ